MSKDLIERGKGVIRLCQILAVIVAILCVVELAIMPGAAMPDRDVDSSAGISTGCPCSGAGSVPTVTPTPVPQSIDQSISTDDQQTSYPDSSSSNTVQPSQSAVPATTVTPVVDRRAGAGDSPVSTAEQPASSAPAGQSTASEVKALSFPSLLGSNKGGIAEFLPIKFNSFSPSWLKTGDTAGEMPADSRVFNLIGRFKSPQIKSTSTPGSTIGSQLQLFSA